MEVYLATLKPVDYAEARRFIADAMRRELVGPLSEDERLSTPSHLRYAAGHIGPDLDDDELSEVDPILADEPDVASQSQAEFQPGEITTDSGVDSSEASSISRSRQQSLTSIGLAFCVRPGAAFDATAQWGEYTASGQVFAREAKREVVSLVISGPMQLTWQPRWAGRSLTAWWQEPQAICSFVRSFWETPRTRSRTTAPIGSIRFHANPEGRHADRPFLSRAALSEDEASVDDLLYRKTHENGIGLHSAVESVGEDPATGACAALRTATVPEVERPTVVQTKFSQPDVLSMNFLATAGQSELANRLHDAFEGYRSWRQSVATSSESLPQRYRRAAISQLADIDSRIDRVFAGIDFLRRDSDAYAAFKFKLTRQWGAPSSGNTTNVPHSIPNGTTRSLASGTHSN